MSSAATQRFDRIAQNFATSEVHAKSASIQRLHELIELPEDLAVIDIACGAGHLALSFGGRAHRIVGVDGAPTMLATFKGLAAARNLPVEIMLAMSESVPLPTSSFDVAVSRLAPHHFPNLQASVDEMARLLRPGGFLGIIDLHGYEEVELDEFNHELELLHDPTHIRSHKPSIWRSALSAAGLETVFFETHRRESPGGITVNRWCEIAASGDFAEHSIRSALAAASVETLNALGIVRAPTGADFLIPVRTLLAVARKPTGQQ